MTERPAGKILVGAVIAVVVAAVIGGLLLIGPPSEQRQRRLDERRVRNLQGIANAVDLYYGRHDRPPTSLEELEDSPTLSVTSTDPESGEPYSYRVTGAETFEVCAVFARASVEEPKVYRGVRRWQHGVGTRCFDLRVSQQYRRQ